VLSKNGHKAKLRCFIALPFNASHERGTLGLCEEISHPASIIHGFHFSKV
jgi:hypothetical protein